MKLKTEPKKIGMILLSLLTSMAVLYLADTSHMVSALALFAAPCFYMIFNKHLKLKKTDAVSAVFAFAVSCALIAGKYVVEVRDSGTSHLPPYAFVYLLALAALVYSLECAAGEFFRELKPAEQKIKHEKLIFPCSALIIIICWLPYFAAQYPCAMTYDSIRQVMMARGDIPLTNHHPILHTLLVKFSLWLGNGSPAAYSLIQIVIMSLIFAFCIHFVYKKTRSAPFAAAALAWFALNPLHAAYSVNMHKDIIFSGLMLLLTASVTELALSGGVKITDKRYSALLILACLGVCFMRNNGLIVVLGVLILTAIIYRQYFKRVLYIICIVFFAFILTKSALFAALNVQPTHFVESVGIPLQQIARTAVDCELTAEQEEEISRYLPVDEMREKYDPYCVDPLKSELYGTSFNHAALENDKSGFARLWLGLLVKHPKTYVKAYLDETYGYWYPLTASYVTHWAFITENDFGIESRPLSQKLSDILGKVTQACFDMKIPVVNILFSAAGMVFICLFFAAPSRRKHGISGLLPYAPLLVLWLTMLIAAPIATSLRYLYSAFTCAPLLAVIPIIRKDS